MSNQLAINGGTPVLEEGAVLPSPPTTDYDRELVLRSLNSSRHAWGENCTLLEKEWAQWNGNAHCAALTSGTSALHMALVACGMRAGDEILTPAYSWTSSASCILHGNGLPISTRCGPTSTRPKSKPPSLPGPRVLSRCTCTVCRSISTRFWRLRKSTTSS